MPNGSFLPNGVTANPGGFAYGAQQQQWVPSFAAMATLTNIRKGFESGSSYSSSSSKISIVKYDDHFKEKDWCLTNLKKPDGSDFTAEEIKKNPPLALKIGDKKCQVVLPIPSYEAMCKATNEMVKSKMTPAVYSSANEEAKKQAADAISKTLLFNFVAECGHGDKALDPACFDKGIKKIPSEASTQAYQRTQFEKENPGEGDAYDKANVGDTVGSTVSTKKIGPNFLDKVYSW